MPIAFVPSTPAPTHPGRFRSAAHGTDLGVVRDRFGWPLLDDVFPDARQIVEAAFGARLDANVNLWDWTDITSPYVQWNPGVDITINTLSSSAARSTPIPSSLTVVLLNNQPNGGDFTLGNAMSQFWPGIVENTPIRARVDIGGGESVRFFGYATSWSPTRGPGGLNLVRLTAHGIGRRVAKGKSVAFSALRKSIERAQPSAYWSLEKGSGGTVGASALAGRPDMTVTAGMVNFGAADDSLPSSLPLAQFSRDGVAGQLTGAIPTAYTSGSDWSLEFVFKAPALGTGAFIIMMHWNVLGTIDLWDVVATPVAAGGLTLRYINTAGGLATYTSGVAVDDNAWHHVRVDCQQTAGIAVQLTLDGEQIISQSTTGTNGGITTVVVNPTSDADSSMPSGGHIAVWNGPRPNTEDTYAAFGGHAGETITERMTRLALEAGVTLEILGDAGDLMGPQRAGALLDLWQDAIDVDGGILVDGLGPGYTYFTRQRSYSRAASLELESAQGDFPGPLEGDHTDNDRVNVYTARDPLTNADRTYEITDGQLGSDQAGRYDTGGDFRINTVDQLDQLAAFKAGLGTVPGLRWPQLTFQLAKPTTSRLAQRWLDTLPSDRIDAFGIDTGTNPNRRLLLRAWREQWNSKLWTVTVGVWPYDGYAVTLLAADTGDTGEFVGWLDLDAAATTDALLPAGGTSVSVTTATPMTYPAVSTYADDLLGLYINLDGLKVAVLAISAPVGFQQTLTLNGADVLRDIPANTTVSAWNPVVLGL
jgi:hypothetical protein